MFYKMAHLTIRKSLVTVLSVQRFAWEVPVCMMKYGADAVEVVKEYWIEKEFVEGDPTPESEHERMQQMYGRDEDGNPYVFMAYGQVFEIGRTLAPMMRECVAAHRPADAAAEPGVASMLNEDALAALMNMREQALAGGDEAMTATVRNLFAAQGVPWVEDGEPMAAEDPDEDDPLANPAAVELPESLDPRGKGVSSVSKGILEQMLVACGVDVDPQLNRDELLEYADEFMQAELAEAHNQPPALEGEGVVARYKRFRPFALAAKRAA